MYPIANTSDLEQDTCEVGHRRHRSAIFCRRLTELRDCQMTHQLLQVVIPEE